MIHYADNFNTTLCIETPCPCANLFSLYFMKFIVVKFFFAESSRIYTEPRVLLTRATMYITETFANMRKRNANSLTPHSAYLSDSRNIGSLECRIWAAYLVKVPAAYPWIATASCFRAAKA